MKRLHLSLPAALLFVLGVATGLSWPNASNPRPQALVEPARQQPSPARRADLLQLRRRPGWVF
ncbi:hypothetical protein AAFN46_13090 [Pseudomonas sp. CAU 1711]|uniref:hypothetical protein n=1 Tax=Pseudomonas sp. CAU 1711 TaxID=3140356 RepID=UPI003260855A